MLVLKQDQTFVVNGEYRYTKILIIGWQMFARLLLNTASQAARRSP